jgi:regulator of sirC expression with transglutaminase-like and TPR domain
MQALTSQQSVHTLSESQRAALVSLLVDEDPAIYQIVRGQLISFGFQACEWLRPHLLSEDPVMRRRSLEIVNSLGRRNSDGRFLEFCLQHGEELDLEEAIELLVQTQYPDTNFEAYQALLDLWAAELRERIDPIDGDEETLQHINHLLFQQLGFSGQESASSNPENCYLNRVIDRREGNAISLCLGYLFIARRLQLPMCVLALPGHFICRYQSPREEWYIDVFRRGKFWTKSDCLRHWLSTKHGLADGYLRPISSRRILQHLCATLTQAYAHLEMVEEVTRLNRYLLALSK